jgi:tRNA nucleotidyltransferase (CCA-adding enzyme)
LIHTVERLTPKTLMKLFTAMDVWRKPERLEQLIIASEADARGRTGFENNPYPQGDYLRAAFKVAASITNREVIDAGFTGAGIGEEIRQRRLAALAKWKQQQERTQTLIIEE